MKKGIFLLLFLFTGYEGYSCTTCNVDLQKAIFDSTFYPNLFTMLSAFIVLAFLVTILCVLSYRREKLRYSDNGHRLTVVPFVAATTTLGIGVGGFIDGTVLHQILQWHEMLSSRIPPITLINKSVNMFWDGIFHLFCLIVVIIGLVLLVRLFFRQDVIISRKVFSGGLFLGWGLFNIVEGVINHHFLKLHNVREISDNVAFWNYGFIGISVLFIILSLFLIKQGVPDHLYQKK